MTGLTVTRIAHRNYEEGHLGFAIKRPICDVAVSVLLTDSTTSRAVHFHHVLCIFIFLVMQEQQQ